MLFDSKSLTSLTIPRSVAIRGYVQNDDTDYLWIQDLNGTWIVPKESILSKCEWKQGLGDPRFSGKPTMIFVRDGAKIHEVREVTIQVSDRPLALGSPEVSVAVKANSTLEQLALNKLRHLGMLPTNFEDQAGSCGPHTTTVCCWGEGSLGTVCTADDSGYV